MEKSRSMTAYAYRLIQLYIKTPPVCQDILHFTAKILDIRYTIKKTKADSNGTILHNFHDYP